jgi:hypothetical protein
MDKPESIREYIDWLSSVHHIAIDGRYETYYESVANKVKNDFEKSPFWVELLDNLEVYDQDYEIKYGFHLFNANFKPKLETKSFASFLLKTFRKNVLENQDWPNPPKSGWFLPENWFSRINDTVRTLLVVKYLDGVSYLNNELGKLCIEKTMPCEASFEAREEGYYAVHFLTQKSFEIPNIKWDSETVTFPVEIQITTQLQEVMRLLLHKYYDEARKRPAKPIEKWQWDYRSDEFCTNYLGHILHYVEGMIMEIREKQRSDNK